MTNHEYLVKKLNILDERTRRMETRLCKLMIAMGVDPAGNDTVEDEPRDYPDPGNDADNVTPSRRQNRFGIPAIFHHRQ